MGLTLVTMSQGSWAEGCGGGEDSGIDAYGDGKLNAVGDGITGAGSGITGITGITGRDGAGGVDGITGCSGNNAPAPVSDGECLGRAGREMLSCRAEEWRVRGEAGG